MVAGVGVAGMGVAGVGGRAVAGFGVWVLAARARCLRIGRGASIKSRPVSQRSHIPPPFEQVWVREAQTAYQQR